MPLTQADRTKIRKFTHEDGSWVELLTEVTQGQRNMFRELSQTYVLPTEDDAGVIMKSQIVAFQRFAFASLCTAWSAPIPPSPEAYDGLDDESGAWVDACIDEVLADRRLRAEGNEASRAATPSSAPTRKSSRTREAGVAGQK